MKIKSVIFVLVLIISNTLIGQEYQLSKPLVKMQDGGFFDKEAQVSFDFRLADSELRYTLDGSEPSQQSHLYKKPIAVTQSCIIKVKAFKKGFRPSETVVAQLQKMGHTVQAIKISPEPSEAYAGEGGSTLINRRAGSMNFRDGQWLGYNKGAVTLDLDLGKSENVKEIMVSTLTSAGAWIMPPASIEFMTSTDGITFESISTLDISALQESDPSGKAYYNHKLSGTSLQYIRLIIQPLSSLPEWHPGKGTPGWLFLDEIIIR